MPTLGDALRTLRRRCFPLTLLLPFVLAACGSDTPTTGLDPTDDPTDEPGDPGDPGSPGDDEAGKLPTWKIGEILVYNATLDGAAHPTLTVVADILEVNGTEVYEIFSATLGEPGRAGWAWISVQHLDHVDMEGALLQPGLPFPLQAGDTTVFLDDPGGEVVAIVEEREDVTVPAGQYASYRIRTRSPQGEVVSWYSGEAGGTIRLTTDGTTAELAASTEVNAEQVPATILEQLQLMAAHDDPATRRGAAEPLGHLLRRYGVDGARLLLEELAADGDGTVSTAGRLVLEEFEPATATILGDPIDGSPFAGRTLAAAPARGGVLPRPPLERSSALPIWAGLKVLGWLGVSETHLGVIEKTVDFVGDQQEKGKPRVELRSPSSTWRGGSQVTVDVGDAFQIPLHAEYFVQPTFWNVMRLIAPVIWHDVGGSLSVKMREGKRDPWETILDQKLHARGDWTVGPIAVPVVALSADCTDGRAFQFLVEATVWEARVVQDWKTGALVRDRHVEHGKASFQFDLTVRNPFYVSGNRFHIDGFRSGEPFTHWHHWVETPGMTLDLAMEPALDKVDSNHTSPSEWTGFVGIMDEVDHHWMPTPTSMESYVWGPDGLTQIQNQAQLSRSFTWFHADKQKTVALGPLELTGHAGPPHHDGAADFHPRIDKLWTLPLVAHVGGQRRITVLGEVGEFEWRAPLKHGPDRPAAQCVQVENGFGTPLLSNEIIDGDWGS